MSGRTTNGSVLSHVDAVPPDSVFNVAALYKQDKHPQKVNLSVGGEFEVVLITNRDESNSAIL